MLIELAKPELRGGGAVHVDAESVESVEDVQAGPHEVCQVKMQSGDVFMVVGPASAAAAKIREAQEQVAAQAVYIAGGE